MVSSCTSTFGKLKKIWEREEINTIQKLSYNIEPEIEILFVSLVFAISVSYDNVHDSFRHVSTLKQVAKLFFEASLIVVNKLRENMFWSVSSSLGSYFIIAV